MINEYHICSYLKSWMCVYLSIILDINECVQGSAGCSHNCTNTAGSFYCTCMEGYELESNNLTCKGNGVLCLWYIAWCSVNLVSVIYVCKVLWIQRTYLSNELYV